MTDEPDEWQARVRVAAISRLIDLVHEQLVEHAVDCSRGVQAGLCYEIASTLWSDGWRRSGEVSRHEPPANRPSIGDWTLLPFRSAREALADQDGEPS